MASKSFVKTPVFIPFIYFLLMCAFLTCGKSCPSKSNTEKFCKMEQGAAGGTWLIEVTVNLGYVRQTVAAVSRLRTICSTRMKNPIVSGL